MAMNFDDHDYVLRELQKAQDADEDNREAVRQAHLFIDKRDGQWEPEWWRLAGDHKPRYTFDLTTPVITQITNKLRQADFAGNVSPLGGEASKDVAKTFDGMVRNIQSISKATAIYNASAKGMITAGIDGWEVVQQFVDSDSFDQDLMIVNVENFVDRVWFNEGAEAQDRSDATMGWKFTGFTKEEYKRKWPKGSEQGLGSTRTNSAYFNKPDLIMVGQFYYIKETDRELVLMSNNKVYEADDDFEKIKDELAEVGVEEVRRRSRRAKVVWQRKMDSQGWLNKAEETVFAFIPLVPTYGNYKIVENKSIYYGVVEKRLDPQRVFNYSLSREIEEGALAPRSKYWLTKKQAVGYADTLATMNTNADPVQFYNADSEAPGPPIQVGGAQINPGLRVISESVAALIPQTAGLFAPNLGDNPHAQSGVAIEKLQNKGDAGSSEYFEAQEIAICHTMRILIKAIPKVYVGARQVRLLREDGSFEMVQLDETIRDKETNTDILINDLSMGSYDVTCSAGASFQNRQQETVSAMVEIGQVQPEVISLGSDILLNNVTAPGMDMIAERLRKQLFDVGHIPEDQWTEEEKAQIQAAQAAAANQPQQPDPAMLIGQAELIKAKNEQDKTQLDMAEKSAKLQLAARSDQREDAKLQITQRNNVFMQMIAGQKAQAEVNVSIVDALATQANTLKIIREAMGVDSIVGPGNTAAYINQARVVLDEQSKQ